MRFAGIALIVIGALVCAAMGDVAQNPAAILGPVIMIVGLVVHFRAGERPRKRRDLADPFRLALRPVFQAHGVPWRAARR